MLVGRSGEAARVSDALHRARQGHGSALFLIGEPGIGKSRLARQALDDATDLGMPVLIGRAVSVGTAVPYRPLAEAFADVPPPAEAEFAPYRSALARVLPGWSAAAIAAVVHESPLVVADGLLRVVRSLAGRRGALLLLEDVHWADADTLAVIEYFADHVAKERVALLMTLRPNPPAAANLARTLAQRQAGTAIDLAPLDHQGVERMVARCLSSNDVPEEVTALTAAAEGVPLLVEDLLAAAAGAGVLVPADDGWRVTGDTQVVPRTFAATVEQRLDEATPETRRVLSAAALVGRRFDWSLLARGAGVDERAVSDALSWAIGAQLVSADGEHFQFRHALTRDAVLGTVLPPDRVVLARELLSAIETADPELSGEWCELAATLAEAAGDPMRAAQLLLDAGRRAAARGALASAEEALRAGIGIGVGADLELEASEELCDVLALAGRTDDVMTVGEGLLNRLSASDAAPARKALVHVRLGRAAVAGERWPDASRHIEAARALAGADATTGAQLDALAAHVAIGRRRPDVAVGLARTAVTAAESVGLADVTCEALEVVGRVARTRDLAEAEAVFRRALDVADANGLTIWRLRALHELGTVDLLARAELGRLWQARELAVDGGAVTTVAVLELQLAAGYYQLAEGARGVELATSSATAAGRLGITDLEAAAWAMVANGLPFLHRRDQLEAMAERALGTSDNLETQASVWGARALASLIEEERGRAARELGVAVANMRLAPVLTPFPSWAMYALLCSVDNREAEAACEELAASGATVNALNRAFLAYGRAVNRGRAGDGQKAESLVEGGDRLLQPMPWWRSLGRRLLAEAAIADGWGDPASWLRESAAVLAGHGDEALAQACQALLRQIGVEFEASVRSTRSTKRGVPAALAALGVTKREAEVLALIGEGLSNGDIAERIYVSPRTVEKHVENLVRKTGVHGRSHLVAYAVSTGGNT